MEEPIFIRSADGTPGSKSHDFTVRFTPELVVNPNKVYYIALNSLSMSYLWHNVSPIYGNNTLKYSHDGGTTWTTITFPAGNYSYANLHGFIKQALTQNNHSSSGISLSFITARFLVYITLEANYQLDFTLGDFSDLIGFNKVIVTGSGYGAKLPDITRSVDEILIHTNIVSRSLVAGIGSDILYQFSVDNLPTSYPFHIKGRWRLFSKINTRIIKDLRIYITDSLNRPVDLNGFP